MKDIVIIGAGGFAKEIIWLLEENNKILSEWNILGFIDRSYAANTDLILGYHIIGDDQWLLDYTGEINAVYGVGNASIRRKIARKFKDKKNIKFPNIISQGAILSNSVKMGMGCIICTNSILTVDVCLGDFVTINLDCTIGHDAVLADYVTLYPSVNVSGNVHIKSGTEIGTGTQIIQGINVGENTIVGAGATVVRNIPKNSTAVGNPAKVIKSLNGKRLKMKTFIIAEAGVNHNGLLDNALKLVDVAVDAGADAIKFQTFKSDNAISKFAPKAVYQEETTGSNESQLEMVKKLELSFDNFRVIRNYCNQKGIMFLSTPFDLDSIDFLESLDLPIYKVPSGEITNLPYLIKIASLGKPIIMSTGMSSLNEVAMALNVLQDNGAATVTLLHCNTQYPTPFEDANIKAMITLKETFGVAVGYSDHTLGIEAPIAAVAMGATVIEKHFTLDKNMEGPDHKASLDPQELKAMVTAIRNIEIALGSGLKQPSESETPNRDVARKSIVAKRNITKGELLMKDNLTVKRPGNGITPMKWFEVLGTIAKRDFCEDELIEL